MNHLETWEMETHESAALLKWRKFCAEAEAALGHSLDGDSSVNGFSLDEAYDNFLAGLSGQEYAGLIRLRLGYNPE